jgi:hypothetical protein
VRSEWSVEKRQSSEIRIDWNRPAEADLAGDKALSILLLTVNCSDTILFERNYSDTAVIKLLRMTKSFKLTNAPLPLRERTPVCLYHAS